MIVFMFREGGGVPFQCNLLDGNPIPRVGEVVDLRSDEGLPPISDRLEWVVESVRHSPWYRMADHHAERTTVNCVPREDRDE